MEPKLMLSWSDDNGHTWSDNRLMPLGKKGEYRKRVIARRLGSGRDRVFKIRCSEPINIVIIEGRLE
ncbi:hypothetical protein [Acinetobacter junii]|uniref:hypothetical protein n=1 Tax=Acinetobacter junii TaxID=40215 RepID=UPI003017323C